MQAVKSGLGSASRLAATRQCRSAIRLRSLEWARVRCLHTQEGDKGSNIRKAEPYKLPPAIYARDWQPPSIDVELRTLRPENLVRDDYVDLSDCRGVAYDPDPSASPSAQVPYLTYGRRQFHNPAAGERILQYTPFPVNTRGFFYYRAHPYAHEGGAVRFRVAPSADPAHFAAGADLLTEHGLPWQIPLLAIAQQPRLAVVRALLLREGLVAPAHMAHCRALVEGVAPNGVGPLSQIVYTLGEPFVLDLTQPTQGVYFSAGSRLCRLTPRRVFVTKWWERVHQDWQYEEGLLKCALTAVVQGGGESSIGLEVQRIIEPVRKTKQEIEKKITWALDPEPGKLLQTVGGAWELYAARVVPEPWVLKRKLLERDSLKRRRDAEARRRARTSGTLE